MNRSARPKRLFVNERCPHGGVLVDLASKEGSKADFILAGIPAFNEEKTIGSVVLGALAYVDKVIVVDDGSTDNTNWIANRAGAEVIRHETNMGYGASLRTCFEYAKNSGAPLLVILDGDGQHQPDLISHVIRPVLEKSADISIGSRFLDARYGYTVPWYRRIGIGIITALTNLGTKRNRGIRDAQSGFRAYSRRAIEGINPHQSDMGASVEILWEADKWGLRVVEVPIQVDYESRPSPGGSLRHGLSVIGSMVRYVETERPMLVFGVAGLVSLLSGLGLGFYVYDSFVRTDVLAVGLSLITVLLVILGILLGFTGLILHAIISVNRKHWG